jgi:hypothetical protein
VIRAAMQRAGLIAASACVALAIVAPAAKAATMTDLQNTVGGAVCLLALVALHQLPWIVAINRRVASRGPLFAVNLFVGWTFLGWLVCMLWAALGRSDDEAAFYAWAAGQ